MMRQVLATNSFYRTKYRDLDFTSERPPLLDDIARLPFTTKSEIVEDQQANPPFGSNLTFPLSRYVRLHHTSGSAGKPLRWLDTAESWQWWLDCWREVYNAAGVVTADRIFFAFSFGPFIGFWTAFEAAQQVGAMVISGGGLSSEQRIEAILESAATVLVCTPTYALWLAEVARQASCDLARSPIRLTIHAGEPGASIPSVRGMIESAWGARCADHAGATEVGAWGYSCGARNGMHINESEFIVEAVGETSEPSLESEGLVRGELVLTNLGRVGSPLIRYRTGDIVELDTGPCPCGRTSAFIRGGILGRADDMIVVRGVNLFPSAVESVIREFPEIVEFQVDVVKSPEMARMIIRIEVQRDQVSHVSSALGSRIQHRLYVRPEIEAVNIGSLPRYELKSRRFRFIS